MRMGEAGVLMDQPEAALQNLAQPGPAQLLQEGVEVDLANIVREEGQAVHLSQLRPAEVS